MAILLSPLISVLLDSVVGDFLATYLGWAAVSELLRLLLPITDLGDESIAFLYPVPLSAFHNQVH